MRKKYFVYIVECSDKTFYIGKSMDFKKRLMQHNGLLSGGAKYTRTRRPVMLRYLKQFYSNSKALQKEYALKQLSRKDKEELIEGLKLESAGKS